MSDQLSFAQAFLDPRLGSNAKLAKIDGLIAWDRLEPLAGKLRQADTGRPPYGPLAMVKALYLQALYDLSDPGLEEALLDRLSFRRFCGFALDASTPDETTLCRFRLAAARAGVLEACFAEIGSQLAARGLILKKGTLLDATLVRATHAAPSGKAGLGQGHPREPGADWGKKNGKSHFGYKLHVGVDQGSGLIRTARVTSARVQDVEMAPALLAGDEAAVYADRGYESKALRAALKAEGVKDRIMHRRHKHIAALPPRLRRRNALIAQRRAPVEAVFSAMKRLYGRARTRCHSLLANAADLIAFATVYNLRRATIIAG